MENARAPQCFQGGQHAPIGKTQKTQIKKTQASKTQASTEDNILRICREQ
jgi:hypothetical protein